MAKASDDDPARAPAVAPDVAQNVSGEIDPRLLEILVCPVTHGPLDYDRGRAELISRAARLAYPIRDGIPIMLPEEARELGEGE